ncbi:MAG TPA: glutaredoxin family protein [Burkholderiaceae bacterium]
MTAPTPRTPRLLACALLALLGASAQAQPVYRIVGPDGKVSFSDRPPVVQDERAAPVQSSPGSASSGVPLPYELGQIAARYPVTLYTSDNCAPCTTARSLLSGRGIPFTERTVNTNDDIAALQRISSEGSLPFVTIGAQKLSGFSDAEWTQYLDAAGYPKQSQLPANYRNPAAAPLVAAKAATPTAGETRAASPAPPRAPTPTPPRTTTPANPAGIQF